MKKIKKINMSQQPRSEWIKIIENNVVWIIFHCQSFLEE